MNSQPTARLDATFDFAGHTRLAHLFAQAPLKIAKTFPRGDSLSVCIMDASPGLLAGDFYEFNWRLEAGAQVEITTQGFTRVHPSSKNPCRLRQNISLARGALLEFFPEPVMLYAGASLRAETTIEIALGAKLISGEVFCAGRTGREIWAFESYQSRQRVSIGSVPVFINQSALRPGCFDPRAVGAYENFTHSATFLAFAPEIVPVEDLRVALEDCPLVYGGVSAIEKHGVVAHLMGNRACDLQMALGRLRDTALSWQKNLRQEIVAREV